ncbi:hypothetical protein HMP09_0565 [Sphingomonas sp. HMP9]|uniref:hypothetical protein n=1 Tax=Sphingomonas sp. HMP9 TaxID=1517554 RepID=UPI001596DDE5|nr:hypothetical protein [Sphingomonas sp. HMP9]BCA61331.1 hypothetical protein HMP09_0565 [Sphingomonas sp. HMP9]
MTGDTLGTDFGNRLPADRAVSEDFSSVDLHAAEAGNAQVTGEAFHHPERDAAGTVWEPNWEPIETYPDGEIVMLDDGIRQLLGRREMGLWMELVDGDELAQPDYQPMLWSCAPEQVQYDMMESRKLRPTPPTFTEE